MSDDTITDQQTPTPGPDLAGLERLAGTWRVSGGTEGTVTYEWMDGGFFMIQHVDLDQYGQRIRGMEITGHLQPFGEQRSDDIWSRYYDSMGNTFDHVYEVDGDTLTIWGGGRGSPAYFIGTFDADGSTLHRRMGVPRRWRLRLHHDQGRCRALRNSRPEDRVTCLGPPRGGHTPAPAPSAVRGRGVRAR